MLDLAIMFSQLKVTPSVFREWMLTCDHENLKYDFLKQLEKYLPSSDELKILADYQNEINELQYSEQYFCAVSDPRRSLLRAWQAANDCRSVISND